MINAGFETKSDIKDKINKLSAAFWNYKGFYNFPSVYKGTLKRKYFNTLSLSLFSLEYELQRPNLKFVKIQFNAPFFDKVTKDRAAKFVDELSAIGGTMGLLTGFSIISGLEILYFALKIFLGYFNNFREKALKK